MVVTCNMIISTNNMTIKIFSLIISCSTSELIFYKPTKVGMYSMINEIVVEPMKHELKMGEVRDIDN